NGHAGHGRRRHRSALHSSLVSSNLQVTSLSPIQPIRERGVTSAMGVIEDLQSAVGAVASTAGPSIVSIGRRHRGSGVIVADGRVVTNAHNIRGDEVTVTFA